MSLLRKSGFYLQLLMTNKFSITGGGLLTAGAALGGTM